VIVAVEIRRCGRVPITDAMCSGPAVVASPKRRQPRFVAATSISAFPRLVAQRARIRAPEVARLAVSRRRGRAGGRKAEARLSKTCRSRTGRPRLRADELIADRGYDATSTAARCGRGGVSPSSPAVTPDQQGSGLGRRRWVVERALVWLTFSADYASAGNANPR
jgi:transposase